MFNQAFIILIKYEWKLFIRNRFQLIFLISFFAVAIYAIYYGKSEIAAQKYNIEEIKEIELQSFQNYKASFNQKNETEENQKIHDMASKPGYAWHRHKYYAFLLPHDYAALAIGQRDLFRYYYGLTGMSLYYQLFQNELSNPVNLLTGNFDWLFIIIYLFPLLIIAQVYSLYSGEREGGTLPLLKIQPISIRKIMIIRISFYFGLITGITLLISLIGMFFCGNPFNSANSIATLSWLTGIVLYSFFWFGLLFLIISFKNNSSFNAIASISCWLLFLIIIPALLNTIVITKYPMSSTDLAEITRRTGLENDDDENEAKAVLKEFFEHRPEYSDSDSLIDNNFMAKTYAAFTWLKDNHSKTRVSAFNQNLQSREKWVGTYDWINPAINIQRAFTETSKTDWGTLLNFQQELSSFHHQITTFYYSRLFWDQPIQLEDYDNRPSYNWVDNNENRYTNVMNRFVQIMLIGGLFFLIGFFQLGKTNN